MLVFTRTSPEALGGLISCVVGPKIQALKPEPFIRPSGSNSNKFSNSCVFSRATTLLMVSSIAVDAVANLVRVITIRVVVPTV